MDPHLRIVSIVGSVILLLVVLELVRRRRLFERYALLWVASAVALLLLAIWDPLLFLMADALGVAYPPNALFLIAFGLILVLLLHFSVAVSRLSDQSKTLAQRIALLEDRLHQVERRRRDGPAGRAPATRAAEPSNGETGRSHKEREEHQRITGRML